jgi:hypothetical protein
VSFTRVSRASFSTQMFLSAYCPAYWWSTQT